MTNGRPLQEVQEAIGTRAAEQLLELVQAMLSHDGRPNDFRKAGTELKLHSPLTNERTPSFFVQPEQQVWYCFSSGQGGNWFQLVRLWLGQHSNPTTRDIYSCAAELLCIPDAWIIGWQNSNSQRQRRKLPAEKAQKPERKHFWTLDTIHHETNHHSGLLRDYILKGFGAVGAAAMRRYYFGHDEKQRALYWYVDIDHRVHFSKAMAYRYNEIGKPTKKKAKQQGDDSPAGLIDWAWKYPAGKEDGVWKPLFGEHRLREMTQASIYLVEAEDSAILWDCMCREDPQAVVLATGGYSMQDAFSRLETLHKRFPNLIGELIWCPDRDKEQDFDMHHRAVMVNLGLNLHAVDLDDAALNVFGIPEELYTKHKGPKDDVGDIIHMVGMYKGCY